jgi:hypothetical protein
VCLELDGGLEVGEFLNQGRISFLDDTRGINQFNKKVPSRGFEPTPKSFILFYGTFFSQKKMMGFVLGYFSQKNFMETKSNPQITIGYFSQKNFSGLGPH